MSGRPLAIAHRAGNNLKHLSEALAAGVDYAETDVWLHRGRLEVRHDKRLGPLPVLWSKRSLRPYWGRRLLLGEVLDAVRGHGRLLLDLKGDAEGLAPALAESIVSHGCEDAVAFTGGWDHLDRLAALLPQAHRYYTTGTPGRLAGLRPRLARGEIAGMAINSRFLTRAIVAELRAAGVERMITWGVVTREKARDVLAWGVSGVTADSLPLLAAIRSGELNASNAQPPGGEKTG